MRADQERPKGLEGHLGLRHFGDLHGGDAFDVGTERPEELLALRLAARHVHSVLPRSPLALPHVAGVDADLAHVAHVGPAGTASREYPALARGPN